MILSQEEITLVISEYMSVLTDTFENDDKEILVYANYLGEYEKSLASSGANTRSIEPIKWSKEQIDIIHHEIMKLDVRLHICAGIRQLSSDTWDVAKAAIPIIVTLQLSGVILLPDNSPLSLSVACIMVGRFGVSVLCADIEKD